MILSMPEPAPEARANADRVIATLKEQEKTYFLDGYTGGTRLSSYGACWEERFAVYTPYSPESIAWCKAHGGRWRPTEKAWWLPLEHLPAAIAFFNVSTLAEHYKKMEAANA